MRKNLEKIIKRLEKADWRNLEIIYKISRDVLGQLFQDRKILKSLIDDMVDNNDLMNLAEHYDFFDKLILYKDKHDRFRLRLHIFSGEVSNKDRPHFHRWNYSSVILNGGYTHYLYGTEEAIRAEQVINLTPFLIREETPGSIYSIDHNLVHSIAAKKDTVSLIIRGPAVKDRFLIIDKKANKKWWEYGRESETIEEIKNKFLNKESVLRTIEKLKNIQII